MSAARYGGAGEAARTLRLLWAGQAPRAAGTPGPKPGLRLDAIVQAAIAIADERGDASISMRAVAGRLGCTAMALYTHVGDRAELLDLMYDRVHEGFPTPGPGTWRKRVGEWARALLDLYVRHRWIGEVSLARPVLGPHEQQVMESLLESIGPAGIGWADTSAIVSSLFSLARTTARTIGEARAAERETGSADREWWEARMRALAEVAPDCAERFPHWTALTRAGAAAGPAEAEPGSDADPDAGTPAPIMERAARRAFRRGVELLLAGAS
ncbi:MAG TPA: TetR/AcrR family transcriptional regulator C-terminal domain-containing protein [Candidatus Dormibacteraeota bacterium]